MPHGFVATAAVNGILSFLSDATAQALEQGYRRRKQKLKARQKETISKQTEKVIPDIHPNDGSELHMKQEEGEGDLPEESVLEIVKALNWERMIRFTCTGIFFAGVVTWTRLHIVNEYCLPHRTGWIAGIQKTVINEGLFGPVVRVWSMATIEYLDSHNWDKMVKKIKDDFWEAQVMAWSIKGPSSALIFRLVPSDKFLQVILTRFFSFITNTYFSYITHRGRAELAPLEEPVVVQPAKTPGELPEEDRQEREVGPLAKQADAAPAP